MLNQLRLPHVFLSFKIRGTVFKNAHLTSLQALPSPSLLSKSLFKNGAYASKSHGRLRSTSSYHLLPRSRDYVLWDGQNLVQLLQATAVLMISHK